MYAMVKIEAKKYDDEIYYWRDLEKSDLLLRCLCPWLNFCVLYWLAIVILMVHVLPFYISIGN